jgi:2',3'-cyclic-nucleotide 2'-phosphodiesterase (5'-nucleotidase family)
MPKLRASHDVVIGLTHIGLDKSSVVTTEQLVKEVPGFDIIIDGHSHTTLPKGMKVGNTLICQTGRYGHALGKVELVVKDHKLRKAQASLLNRQGVEKLAKTPDEGVAQALQEINMQVKMETETVVAESPRELTAAREIVRTQESELGNLTADALRQATGADVAVVNGGNLRTSLPAGKITKGAVLDVFPFNNRVLTLAVDGKTLKSMLELSVQYLPAAFGGFLDVSGMTFTVDTKAPAGQRVSEVKVQGQPLAESKNYMVAVNDFTAFGGDGYEMLKGAQLKGDFGSLEDIFVEYLQKNGLQGIEVGRITMK